MVFGCLLLCTIAEWAEKSQAAISFGTLLSLLALWFGIQVPLVFLGSMLGFKSNVEELPEPALTEKAIPEMPWWLKTKWIVLVGGFASFVAAFVELVFVVSSIWRHSL